MTDYTPVKDRVVAPDTLPTISHESITEVLAGSEDQLDALVALIHAADAVDHPSWLTPREEVEEYFDHPRITAADDMIIAYAPDGTAAGFALVMPAAGVETRVQVYVIGTVRPDLRGKGIGTQLIGWAKQRAYQRLAEREEALPAWIVLYTQEQNESSIELAQSAGFAIERYFHTMVRDLAEEIPEVAVPDGIRLEQYTPALEEQSRLARNDAFRDHWGSQPTPEGVWRKFVTGEIYRPDLSVVAIDEQTDQVVAFALASYNPDDDELQGYSASYIDLIGVVRAWRGRKLAPAVIAQNLRLTRDVGLEKALLDVDSASPTGANTLYEGMGFTATDVEVALVIEV